MFEQQSMQVKTIQVEISNPYGLGSTGKFNNNTNAMCLKSTKVKKRKSSYKRIFSDSNSSQQLQTQKTYQIHRKDHYQDEMGILIDENL